MPAGDAYLRSIGKAANHAVLSPHESRVLAKALQTDSQDFFQAAVVSFVDALRSIELGFFSWATVKLYYSVFYLLRAYLAVDGDCIFYVVKSPKVLSASPGCVTQNLSGNTHKAVLSRFQSEHPNSYFLSQEIASKPPLEWFIEKREQTNYIAARFCEPDTPIHLKFAAATTRRKMLTAYLADDVYVFDEDHAIVAFPFKLLRELRSTLASQQISPLLLPEIHFLKNHTKDRTGFLASLDGLLF